MAASTRRRLAPEDRRNQILDCAQRIIVDHGLSTLTMEMLATEAGVSNPLIYKYFDTRLQILQVLLIREYRAFRKSVTQNVASVDSYRDAVRGYVDVNFRQFAGGDVMSILLGQADVRHVIEAEEKGRHAPYFIKELAKEYKVRRRLAEKLVVLASGASIAAAEHYGRFGGDREAQIDQTVTFIFGGIEQLLAAESSD
jgi:AcrR family transcriptional regulator